MRAAVLALLLAACSQPPDGPPPPWDPIQCGDTTGCQEWIGGDQFCLMPLSWIPTYGVGWGFCTGACDRANGNDDCPSGAECAPTSDDQQQAPVSWACRPITSGSTD